MIKTLLFVCIASLSLLTFSQVNNTVSYIQLPENYSAKLDIVYSEVGNWKGKLDVFLPDNTSNATPLIINIHGGGWNHGAKETQTGFGSFFKIGYAVANIEYRLVDVAPAPAAIEDVRCALMYLYNHAKAFNIDTSKIILMGGSAGGHLALMAGLLGDDKTFDTSCKYDGDIKIAAIINKYGVTDLVPLGKWGSAKRWLGEGFNNHEFVRSVSPIYHITKDSPPVFIVHGDADPVVPYSQSVELHKKLLSLGIKTKFVTIPHGKHGKFSQQEKKRITQEMLDFLKELKI
ncbi:acetyl esterase/lipase [Flavobacteriaceae bacterium MAR_2010_72]|nr:acetyl esterase/lipase [Flavobacteriaceae bacterium MAR_2010_72]TVZ58643.1 acetyl esterase/lipase [Flavobacteriaceae bacterium MAR_2010_105]